MGLALVRAPAPQAVRRRVVRCGTERRGPGQPGELREVSAAWEGGEGAARTPSGSCGAEVRPGARRGPPEALGERPPRAAGAAGTGCGVAPAPSPIAPARPRRRAGVAAALGGPWRPAAGGGWTRGRAPLSRQVAPKLGRGKRVAAIFSPGGKVS